MNFQPSDMSWSYRKRGSVQRIQMKTNTNSMIFSQKNRNVANVLMKMCGATLSHAVNGMSHPPKKSVAISALAVIMFAYSAMKNIENFIALYSEWYPAMSSDSASGKSKGRRFVSANAATMKTKNAIVQLMTFQWSPCPPCCFTMLAERDVAGEDQHGDRRHPHRDLVGDHLRARAETAEQRVLVVRRPSGEHDAVHAERRDREDEEEADRQRRERHVDRAPLRVPRRAVRNHRPGEQRRNERHHRRENEQRVVTPRPGTSPPS